MPTTTFIGRGPMEEGGKPDAALLESFDLYREYDRQDIINSIASANTVTSLCNGQWILCGEIILCLTTIGPTPRTSYFRTATRFRWVADDFYQIPPLEDRPVTWRQLDILPSDVVGGNLKGRSIHLFARHGTSTKYRYLGRLGPSYVQQGASPDNYGEAEFDLSPALASAAWEQIGGFAAGDTNHAAIDSALNRLGNTATLQDRLDALQRLVEYWHGPIRPDDGFPNSDLAGVALPKVLRWWYGWAGKRTEIMTGQNILYLPRIERHQYWQLKLEDGYLHFYVENQGVYQWATLADGDDPPVFGRWGCEGPWEGEGLTVSEHLTLACIFEAVICHARYGASKAWLAPEKFREIALLVPPLKIGSWRWAGKTRAYGRNGVFMCAGGSDEEGGYSVWIGAKTEHPLQSLKPFFDRSWEYVSV